MSIPFLFPPIQLSLRPSADTAIATSLPRCVNQAASHPFQVRDENGDERKMKRAEADAGEKQKELSRNYSPGQSSLDG